MERARRSIKTPKRFDEEPFETPRKNSPLIKQQQQLQQQQQQLQQATPPEPTPKQSAPEQTPSKNIIKVKLNRSRPRDPPYLSKSQPSPALPSPPVVTPQRTPQHSSTPATSQSSQSSSPVSPALQPPPPLKQQPPKLYPQKRGPKKASPRPIPPPLKVSCDVSLDPASITSAPPKVRKQRSPSRPTPNSLPQTPLHSQPVSLSTPTSYQSQQQPSIPIISRPKIRRPKTPPAFGNLIPNVVLPFWDARTAAEEHEDDNVKELVHCQCGIGEELGLMVQCETCLTWQHAHCLGIEKPEDAPDGYTCQACSDPKFARESMRHAYDQDWLTKGRMKQFACNQDRTNGKNSETLLRMNKLLEHALKIYQLKHSLKVKSRLLREAGDDDPELRLFKNPWPANYMHMDGTQFVPTINHMTSCTPALSLSAMAETPDPGYIPVETVAEATLPDIGQLEDVSAILDNTDIPNSGALSLQKIEPEQEATTPDGFRANLRLHIQQTDEFISLECATIDKHVEQLQKESLSAEVDSNPHTSFQSLKNDLNVMKNYIASTKRKS